MGEWYARHLYRWISAVLSWISYWTLFSLDDIFIYGSIAGIIIYCIYAHIKHLNWKHTLGRTVEYLLWVYAWSAISGLSEMSIARGGALIDFPDFTRGQWINRKPSFALGE